jgi:hypothetical protein
MNDALMIGVVLTLVFGAIIFYLYNRLSMTEKKMGLFEGVLTDLKVMMDAAPYVTGPPPSHMAQFEPTPEYLNAISEPVPLKREEMEEVDEADEAEQLGDNSESNADTDYQQTLEQALETATELESRTLHIDDTSATSGQNTSVMGMMAQPVNVTKLSPDLDSMTVKELHALAREKGVTVPAATRRKELIELIRKSTQNANSMLDGPMPSSEGSPFNMSEVEVTL